MKRRRIRRYQRGLKNSGMKIITFVGIMIIAIILGYLTTRFIIAPIIGYDTDVLKLDLTGKLESLIDVDNEQTDTNDGKDKKKDSKKDDNFQDYVIQFGVFSGEERAEQLVEKLKNIGITTTILEKDSQYKVISKIFDNKDEAVKHLKEINEYNVTDVFITVIEDGKDKT